VTPHAQVIRGALDVSLRHVAALTAAAAVGL
jgi:hypothetical protein